MKANSAGGWIAAAVFLLFFAWQLLEAVFFGRMMDIASEDDDYLYFFEHPFLFCTLFLVYAGVGYWIVHFIRKELRRRRRQRYDG